jgi:signal transduction histidine kinase
MSHIIRVRPTCFGVGIGLFLLASFVCQLAAAAEPKRVVLLHSFGRDFKPWSEYARTIRTELERQSPWPLEITDHSLLTSRSSDEGPEISFVEYLRALFAKHPLDLIVSIGAPAAAFVQRHRQQLFAATPMVFTAVDQRRVEYSSLTANDAVVAVRINYFAAIENILQVLPDTENITVVIGTSPIEKFWKEAIGKEVAPLASRVAFSWTDHFSFEQLLKHAAALPPRSAIFWELMIVDAAGVVHEGSSPLTKLHAVANAPIFSYDESFFEGRDIVGGPLLLVNDSSRQTAEVAIRILGGEQAGDIKIPPVQFAKPRFDWREMQRWGISESRLPPGSEVYFRDPAAWELYRIQILLIAAAILFQSALIWWLVHERRYRQRAEAETREAMSELTHMNRIAGAGELSASIAHEVNQPLSGIVTSANAALRWLARETPDLDQARRALHQIVAAGHRAGQVVQNVRSMFKKETQEKAPVDVNDIILEVLALSQSELQKHQIPVQTRLDEWLPNVMGIHVQLQQVILNLVMNAVDAMGSEPPRMLRIQSYRAKPDVVHVSVEDTGTGIDPANRDQIFKPLFTTKMRGMGMGLSICQSIIESHGGRIWVSPAAHRGSIFQFELPTGAGSERTGAAD